MNKQDSEEELEISGFGETLSGFFSKNSSSFWIEALVVLFLVAGLWWSVHGVMSNHQIEHESPHGYSASDGFAYLFLSEHTFETGSQKYHPFYSAVGYRDVLWVHGIIVYNMAAMTAKASGLPVYDSLMMVVTLSVILNALAIFAIIRSYNKKIAIISAAFFLFIATNKFYMTFLWGQFGAVSGMLFFTGLIWWMSRKEVANAWILVFILFVSSILAHIPEFIFAVVFMTAYLLIEWMLKKKIIWQDVKSIVIGGVLSLLATSYYLIIFWYGAFKTQGASTMRIITVEEASKGLPVVSFTDFTMLVCILIVVGVILSLYYVVQKKEAIFPLIMGFILLGIGFANYYGFGYRAFHVRAFWPLYIAVCASVAVYFIMQQILKMLKLMKFQMLVSCILAIVIFLSIYNYIYAPIQGAGVLTKPQWDAMQWINQNTKESDKIFLFYGDVYSQSGRMIHRLTWNIDAQDYFSTLQAQQISRYYKAELLTLHTGDLMYWAGFAKVGYHKQEDNVSFVTVKEDICSFDYIVFDKVTPYIPNIAQANMYIAQLMFNHNLTVAYDSNEILILNNKNLGGECIA